MKKIIGLIIILSVSAIGISQTDELNTKKYWKFRNSFRENFVKIGALLGDGIPAVRRNLGDCVDNRSVGQWTPEPEGTLYYGDGMIRQGHYIGFLATEYRLLKNNGGDVTAVLNELFYALNAINRVDLNAELTITTLNGALVEKPQSLNGFYLRDDIPENYYEKWQDTPIRCRCNAGSVYLNNNVLKQHNVGDYKAYWGTSDHSIPSLDQMTSLLVGLSVCDKLLDNGLYVQPTPSDPVMDLRNEVKQITNRIISYAYQHNWYLLDEWGWPVGNGGGELLFTAYPITVVGENIVGNDYSSAMKRKSFTYGVAQAYHCLPTQDDKDDMWDTLNLIEKAQVNNYSGYNPWPLNVGGPSNFEDYQSNPSGDEFNTEDFAVLWNDMLPTFLTAFHNDWQDNQKFDDFFGSNPIGNIVFGSYCKPPLFQTA